MYEMLFGKIPWSYHDEKSLTHNIMTKPLEFPKVPKISDAVKDFITRCC
jgi:hypothetical protein